MCVEFVFHLQLILFFSAIPRLSAMVTVFASNLPWIPRVCHRGFNEWNSPDLINGSG